MTDTEKFTLKMIKQLEECVKAFSNNSGAIFQESKITYKNKHRSYNNISSYDILLYYNNHIIKFSYYPHILSSTAHSVLTCYISLDKTDTQKLFYPLSQIYSYLGITPDHALAIPMILSSESMTESFIFIAESLTDIYSDIIDLSYDQRRKELLFDENFKFACNYFKSEFPTHDDIQSEIEKSKENWYNYWVSNAYGELTSKESEENARADFEHLFLNIKNQANSLLVAEKQKFLIFYFQYCLTQSLNSSFEAYMIGDYATAIKKLNKIKNKTQYEILLINYMKSEKLPQKHVPESVFKNLTELYKNGIPKNNFKESLAMIIAMIMVGVIWIPFFLIPYLIFYFFESIGSIYLLGPLENMPMVIVPSLLMAIPTIYFNSKKFYKIFFKKNYKRLIDLNNSTYSHSTHKFIKFITVVLFICSIALLFFTVHQNIKLTEDGFYDNTKFFSIKGNFYEYDDVKVIKLQQKPTDKSSSNSFTILLKNGEELYINQFDSCTTDFINKIKSKNIKVE